MKYITLILYTVCLLCSCLYGLPAYAQVCTGSLGNPVVNVDFGSGGNAGVPLAADVTNYTYRSGCPSDGQYALLSTLPRCYNTWHTLPADHTPNDNNGYMMVVNAASTPGIFYKQTVTGLCPNTTYEFAAWVINLIAGSNITKPNITFTIETTAGQLLAPAYETGDIPEISPASWKQYGFLFTTTANMSEVVLVMKSNASNGTGNDLALDDITFRPCGPVLSPTVTVLGNSNNRLCEAQAGVVELDAAVSPGYSSPVYKWQVNANDGAGWKDVSGATTIKYVVNIPNASINGYQYRLAAAEGSNGSLASCRIFSAVVAVSTLPKVTADAGPDKSTLELQPVQLQGKATGANATYYWTPATYLDDANSLTPFASAPADMSYTLHVLSADGCASTAVDEVDVRVYKKMVIPNTFSPNADGVNDSWTIIGLETYASARTIIYNRYGEMVFTSTGYARPWDGTYRGKPVPVGTYTYLIDLKNGSPKLSGWLLVVR